ncbi:glycoside hydrolase family 2 TIM barrel-domain containing protein [uncultured Actinomyces sp.]|uniref:glycoside hydrolase family 2 TIM barrel-domain containing protein n=1 Tax=uncultured Actinomyces sp. TaxID=249061 RepID=UPI0037DD914A
MTSERHANVISILPSYAPGAGALLPPRAHLADDPGVLSLDGTWSFVYHRTDPTPWANVEEPWDEPAVSDDADTIDVPSHWVLRGDGRYGRPAYTNVDFPFPVDPPYPPEANPVGDYHRTFEMPDGWEDDLVVLRFDGVESQVSVWVNGAWVGMARGSRLAHECDITGRVHPGENTITVRVHQFSPGSYLEDQDQWWLPGIFRSVSLRRLAPGSIEDLWIDTDYEAGVGYATVEARVLGARAASLVGRLAIDGLGTYLLALEKGDDGRYRSDRLQVGDVRPWNPEDPALYEAHVSINGGDGLVDGDRRLRVGFRRVSIEDGVLTANGKPLRLNGVNRHEVRADEGRVFDEEWARADLALMKSMGINAIRTSHYTPHPRLLDLADEIGLWVMLEGDIETHGFEGAGEWIDNPSDDPRWSDAYLDRTIRAFERDKNHPSIMSWSLGNESGTGANLAACARWIHERTGGRAVVHYEGDHALEYTDIYSRMYPTLEEVAAVLDDSDLHAEVAVPTHVAAQVDDAARERIRRAPYLMCEYLHAMGTGPAGAPGYAAQMSHPRHAGGFVWEWRDHALWRTLPDGRRALSYGGDFGEEVHDGNFVCDGLVDALSRPYAGTWAWVAAMAPDAPALARAIAEADSGSVGERDRLRALAETDLVPCADEADSPYALDESGRVARIGDMPVRIDLSVFRAPTDNDRGRGPVDYWGIDASNLGPLGVGRGEAGTSHAMRWECARLHLLRRRLASIEEDGGVRRVVERWAPPAAQFGVTLTWEYAPVRIGEEGPNALSVSLRVAPYGTWPPRVPRLGLRLELPGSTWHATWLGDTMIGYADMSVPGARGCGSGDACDLWDVCVRPQEGGHRQGLEALSLRGEAGEFLILPASPLGWSVSRWSERELAQASHWEDLPDSERLFLWLDVFQDGIGTRSCGPDARPEVAGRMRDVDVRVVIAQVRGD